MGVDFMIERPCRARETLTSDGLLSLIKQRNICQAVVDHAKSEGKTNEEILNTRIKKTIYTPSGYRLKEESVSEMIAAIDPLAELAESCRTCPANFGRAFGCYSAIKYPISENAERWLAGLARKAVENRTAGQVPLLFVDEKDINGALIARMRADTKGGFFERRVPLEIALPTGTDLFKRKTITTDQLLEIILGIDRMGCDHMKILLVFAGDFRVRDDDSETETASDILILNNSEGKKTWWTFYLHPEPSDDPSISQFKKFFQSMFVAAALGCNMIINR